MKADEPKMAIPSLSLQTKSGEQQTRFFDKKGTSGMLSNSRQPFFSFSNGSSSGPPPFSGKPGIQTKPAIGKTGDKYEREADAPADRVMQRLAENNQASGQPALKIPADIQRKPIHSESEPKLQPKSINDHSQETTIIPV